MGIKDLSTWIKKHHPTVLKTFPKRWASPEIQGTRVAIDATLLTNRFHFAVTDGELRGKGALIGWYNLINVMRAHNVKPIAVWDRPGTRAWKFGENKRRWVTRGLNYARRTHEEKREERLAGLKEAFVELERMDAEEQGAVRDHLSRGGLLEGLGPLSKSGSGTVKVDDAATRSTSQGAFEAIEVIEKSKLDTVSPPPATSPYPSQPASSTSTSAKPTDQGSPDELASLERIADMTDTITSHIQQYRESLQTPEISLFPTQTVLEEALERVKELEDLYESLDDADIRMRPAPRSGSPRGSASPELAGADGMTGTVSTLSTSPEIIFETGPAADDTAPLVSGEQVEMHEALKLERARERDQEWLVEKMSEIMPPSLFSESRRQVAMSDEEGRILQAFLRPASSPSVNNEMLASPELPSVPVPPIVPPPLTPSATTARPGRSRATTPPSLTPEQDPLEDVDPLDRLTDLLAQVPETKGIYDRALGQPNKYTYLDCQDLLHRMGVPVIMADAPYEAEGLATALQRSGLADWVATEDSDVLPLGGRQLRSVSSTKQPLSTTLLPDLLTSTSLTPEQFTDFCILLGNDAIPRIRSVGPVTAYKLIREHGTIEAALAASPKLQAIVEEEMDVLDGQAKPGGYTEMVRTARVVFGVMPEITDEMRGQIERAGLLDGLDGSGGAAESGTPGDGEVDRRKDEGVEADRDEGVEAVKRRARGMTEQERLADVERWLEEKHGVAFVAAVAERFTDLDVAHEE